MGSRSSYLPAGLPVPESEPDGLSEPYWRGLAEGALLVQHCDKCGTWQFAAEWICHDCHAFEPRWERIEPKGCIYSWERVWHPVHPCLREHGPYLVVLVELSGAGNVRMIGNLLGDPLQVVEIGAKVSGVFEKRHDAGRYYGLLHWKLAEPVHG